MNSTSALSILEESRLRKTSNFFDDLAPNRQEWKKKNSYYYSEVTKQMQFLIPAGYKVLEIGSGDGDLLADLKPSKGLGIDASPLFVKAAQENHPELEFKHAYAENFCMDEKFDYIVLSNLVGYLNDVQLVLENIKQCATPKTRIVIQYYNYLWEPLLVLGDKLGLRMKQGVQNWLSLDDLENLLRLSGFETVKRDKKVLFPFKIPLVSWFMNRIVGNLPWIHNLCLSEFIVARPKPEAVSSAPSISIMVPTKDEKGNIYELVERTPAFPGEMEMVFVDGHSTDGTMEEIQRAGAAFPQKNVQLLDQGKTKGKGPAVRLGFEQCRGDILLILDSDISVAPEDTRKFYDQLVLGNGEMVNGTRLVYPMEKKAMRFLNILANKFFSLAFTYLLGQRLKDTLCGTKAMYREDYLKIAANRAYFGDFDPFGDFDLIFGAAKLNMKIIDMPVRYYERRYGDIKINRFRHGTLLLGMCVIALKKLKFT